ncbi:C-terminal helicase domain-containing protein [Pontibacillus litoralis]|uniref:Helicase C-terminal domain-containing protein n=1 Tax=Pontibacillus litoralis JSM 072002 TaxID=1385512 RepID=A0A0A5HMK7_9BACI|nr:C-terminal helicase domain-containing protein [Pontibacillus litoralis]KGX84857.1 hypothetical protein N784_11815 [Pontibacillus litoralis JSM 072002]
MEDYEEESLDTKEQIENQLLDSIDDIDPEELKIEIAEINNLIDQSTFIRNHVVERKYRELEETLFGMNGLLNNDEKILIFTESKDTLKYLERKLLERVPSVAKIIGDYSMDERRKQVDQFKNESQIMLATDAGGESINLQFCNQMVNYDIPWNPNRLEQRMGRIHRIGQNNEVFSFNLVAENTREGNVMVHLIEKLERMRTDLGSDLVYDFIGDVLEDRYDSLSNLMQDAILNREKLNEIINDMEKTLSQEHAKLLKLVQDEKVDEDIIDLPHLKREHNDVLVQRLPTRSYVSFIEKIFKLQNIRVYDSSEGFVKRIERFPKYIREMAMKENIQLDFRESMKFTGFQRYESSDVKKIDIDSPLLQLGMNLTKKKLEQM